jgi:hypothetical protein
VIELEFFSNGQGCAPRLDFGKPVHHLEQSSTIALVERVEPELFLPSAKGDVVITTFRLVDVCLAHRCGSANHMRRANLLPIFEGRVSCQAMPRLLATANGGLIGIGWPGQPIIVDCLAGGAQVNVRNVPLDTIVKTDF